MPLDVASQIKTALDEGLKDVRDKLKDKDPGKKVKEEDDEPSAEVLKLREKQEQLERQLREQQEAAEASAQRERDGRLDGALQQLLQTC